MKRLHVHISVADLQQGIYFYSQMFGAEPSKIKPDYAKWQLEDPQINFAISTRSKKLGLDHLGIQVSAESELNALSERLTKADNIVSGELNSTTCCYAQSVKSWTIDPAGIPWESFITMGDADVYGVNMVDQKDQSCCSGAAPENPLASSCC
jgi:predicted enzyme related to lactoylglutathione lyase